MISQQSGILSPVSNQKGSVYSTAHSKATNQSGPVFETLYNAAGRVLNMTPLGAYPSGITRVEWHVLDKSGNKVVIQKL